MTTSTPVILELRHAECESPGAYLAGLADLVEIHTVRVWQEPLPTDLAGVTGLLVMGGPMGANDGPTLPWIDAEIAFIRAALDADIPVWGVCLGSQLLARALGAEVHTGPDGEIGIGPVTLTAEGLIDPVFSCAPTATFPVMHWHYDTFAIPAGAVRLAGSAHYDNQVFRHGSSYGVQCHLEVDPALFAAWLEVPEYRDELVEALGPHGPATALTEVHAAADTTAPLAATLIRHWLRSCVGISEV